MFAHEVAGARLNLRITEKGFQAIRGEIPVYEKEPRMRIALTEKGAAEIENIRRNEVTK